MSNTNFLDGTPIIPDWLNDVNDITYELPSTASASSGAGLVGFSAARNYAVNTIGWAPKQLEYSAKWFGVLDDGSDQSTNIQAFLNLLSTVGGVAFFSKPATRYQFATALTIPSGVHIKGEGRWSTILRYTGIGTAFIASGTSTNNVMMSDFSLQLSGAGAIGIDCSRFISSTFRSIRVCQQASTGQIGIYASITNTAWTSYFNVFNDVMLDGLTTGVQVKSSVAQYANRWRWISPTFLSCADCFDIQGVQGMQIIAPYFNENTGVAIKLGAAVDRLTVVNATMESNVGGTLWSVNATCNRLTVLGYEIHAGTDGMGSGMGKRALVIANWDNGVRWSGSTTATSISQIATSDNVGMQQTGVQGVSSTATASKNLCGTNTFTSSGTCTISFARAEPDSGFRVVITGRANENFWVTTPTINGFTCNSSNAASVAQFDWIIIR